MTDHGTARRTNRLRFRRADTGEALDVSLDTLVVAGFTGRDKQAVQAHVDELAALGVPTPARVPSFYPLAIDLLTSADVVPVVGSQTSGEVEPVLVRSPSGWMVTVGSDHTDRALELQDILASKRACPKVVGDEALPLELVESHWDGGGRLRSWVDGEPYQDALLEQIMPPRELLETLTAELGIGEDGLVVFCGTVPLLDGEFRYGQQVELELALGAEHKLSCTYRIEQQEEAP